MQNQKPVRTGSFLTTRGWGRTVPNTGIIAPAETLQSVRATTSLAAALPAGLPACLPGCAWGCAPARNACQRNGYAGRQAC